MKSLMKNVYWVAIIAATALMLDGCGGGGGSTPSNTSGSAVSQGVITQKGSIFVNGIEYSSNSSTSITIDGSSVADDSFLKEGMTVKVRGSSDDVSKKGTATKIEARDALEGKIDSIDSVNKTITVMGQTVQIEDNVTRLNDDNTQKVFSDASFVSGDIVEVNGFSDDQGGLHASRVAKKLTSDGFESKGFVTNLVATSFGLSRTPGTTSFITVNFTAPLPVGVVDGSLVEVKSTVAPIAGAITASSIRLEDSLGSSGEKVEIEGIVSGITPGITSSDFDIVVNGQAVIADTSTVYEGGLSSDLALGVKLEAKGQLSSSGVLVASKISFRSNIKIEGDASAVSATGLTVLGKFVTINQLTRIDNVPVNGSHIEVRAKLDRDGNLIATRIRNKGGSNYFLQGRVGASDSAAGTLTILGLLVTSDSSTQWRISSTATDVPVTQSAFFAQLTSASVVKVKWSTSDTSLPIKEAEIELGR